MLGLISIQCMIICLYLSLQYISAAGDDSDTIGYAGMVSSTHYLASEAGRKVLLMGGKAADAAVAVQMVLNVVEPTSSGIGGGAFIMYYDSETDSVVAIDGREEAPNAFNPYVFCANIACYDSYNNNSVLPSECRDCDVIPWPERTVGGFSVGVPGTLYAFKRLWEAYGSGTDIIPWSDLFTDAIAIAQNGYTMYEALLNYINLQLPYLARYNSSCKLLLNYPICNESKYDIGDTVYNADLAATFQTLSSMTADDAINEFYAGTIASDIVQTVHFAHNNITNRTGLLSMADLATYRAVFREPLSSTIQFDKNNNDKIFDVYGMNMPSSGPLTIQYELKLLQHLLTDTDIYNDLELSSFLANGYGAEALHYLFSIGNIAFADRNEYMADRDFVNVPVEGLQDYNYIKQRAMDYINDTLQQMPVPFGYPAGYNETYEQSVSHESGTAHFCIVDRFGNVASITSTIEGPFGSQVAVDGYGFFLNNELTDFNAKGMINYTRTANGAEGGKKQRISAVNLFNYADADTYGGKRPRSSMSPLIVLNHNTNKPYLAVGGRGGSSIISNTFDIVVRHLLYSSNIQTAINDARLYSTNSGSGQLKFEKSKWQSININITQEMVRKFGYDISNLIDTSYGSCNGISIDNDNNLLYCGVDKTRRALEGCAAVCNSTDSVCPFAATTAYPQSTATSETQVSTTQDGTDAAVAISSLVVVKMIGIILFFILFEEIQ